MDKIKHINIAVTNKCNLRCRQCSIWREEPKQDLSSGNIKDIIDSPVLDDDADITLTGGEPFLHEDLSGIVRMILDKRPRSLRSISTNGTLTRSICDLLAVYHARLTGCALHISLDGINRHDEQRGKSLETILQTIAAVKESAPDMTVKLKFTVTPLNYTDILPTYDYAKSHQLEFKIKLVESAGHYTNKVADKNLTAFTPREKKRIARDLFFVSNDLKRKNPKESVFIRETIKFLLGKNSPGFCRTPFDRIFVMPDGLVYSCIHFEPIGRIYEKNLQEIWHSPKAGEIRAEVKQNGCSRCVSYHGFSPAFMEG